MLDRTHRRLLISICALLLSTLVACGAQAGPSPDLQAPETQATETDTPATPIPFSTVAQDAPLGDQPAEPYFDVIANPQTGESWQSMVPEEVIAAMQGADGEQGDRFVVTFAGAKASSGYSVTIEQIVHQGTDIIVTVSMQEPDPDDIVEPAMTLPFHVVAISRDLWPTASQVSTVIFRDGAGNLLERQQVQN